MAALLHDIQRACRALMSRPGYVAVATLTLALAIGVTTAIFSVVDALMLRPLPLDDPERIVEFAGRRQNARVNISFSHGALRTLQQLTDTVERVEAYSNSNRVLTGGAEPLNVTLLQVSPGLMDLLGVSGSRVMSTLLFQTTPTDPSALAGGATVLLVLALVACYVPARRARQVDPLVMLRVE